MKTNDYTIWVGKEMYETFNKIMRQEFNRIMNRKTTINPKTVFDKVKDYTYKIPCYTVTIGKGIELEKRAAAIENGILQGKNLEQAQKSVTVQEQYADAIEQVKELFSDIVTGGYIETLVNGFKSLVGLAKTLGTIIDIAIIKPLNIAVNLAAAAVESILALIPGSGVTLEDAKKSFEFAGANAMDMAVNTGNLLGVTDQKDMFTKQVLNNNPGSDDLRKVAGYENKDSAETNKLLNELIA